MKIKTLWIFLAFVVALGMLWQFYPLSSAADRLEKLPLIGTQFGGKEIPVTDFEKTFFYNVAILKRLYDVKGQILFITALDGTYNRHIVHDPYYCFKGSGWDILSEKIVEIPRGTASLVKIRKEAEEKDAMFWFADGQSNYSSPLRYWWETTLRRLSLGSSGEEPVLILIQPINRNELDWKVLPGEFPSLFKL